MKKEKKKTNYVSLYFITLVITLFVCVGLIAGGVGIYKLANSKKTTDEEETYDYGDETDYPDYGDETETKDEESSETIPTESETEPVSYKKVVKVNGSDDRGSLVLANSEHPYTIPEDNTLATIYSKRSGRSYQLALSTLSLSEDSIYALNTFMQAFYSATGLNDVNITYAYVDNAAQASLYKKYVNTYGLAKANELMQDGGCSDHNTGLGFDAAVYTGSAAYSLDYKSDYQWLKENGHKYGYIERYPDDKKEITGVYDDPWHFRYVGVPHAYYMYKNNLCLEEYIKLLEGTCDGEPLIFTDDDGSSWEVFCYRSDGAEHEIEIDQSAELYSESGTNTGYIAVTIKK